MPPLVHVLLLLLLLLLVLVCTLSLISLDIRAQLRQVLRLKRVKPPAPLVSGERRARA